MFSWFIRILLLTACVCLTATSHAKVCGDSPKLYEAIDEAGFTVHDVWITPPKEYTDATALFGLLRDYDFAVLKPGSRCKKMMQELQAAVFEHVRKYGTFIKPPEGGHWFSGSEAYMLSGKSSVRLDGQLRLNVAASSDGEQLPGIYVAPGEHVLTVDLPRLPPGQRLHVVARLDGKVLKRSAPGTFDVEFTQATEGNPVTHELTFKVKLVRECQATLKLSGKLTQPTPGRRIIFDVPTAGKALTPGANPLPGGNHKLRVIVMNESAPALEGPPVLKFGGAVLPTKDTSTSSRQSWDYDVDLSCPEGVATVQEHLRAEGPPTVGRDDDEGATATSPPTWHFWAATGLTGVAATVGIVSYVSAEDRTEQWETLASEQGCASTPCDAAVLSEIADLYDQADTRYNVAVGSFVVAGVGVVGMGLSWIYREELAGTKAEGTALVPVITRDGLGFGAIGRF